VSPSSYYCLAPIVNLLFGNISITVPSSLCAGSGRAERSSGSARSIRPDSPLLCRAPTIAHRPIEHSGSVSHRLVHRLSKEEREGAFSPSNHNSLPPQLDSTSPLHFLRSTMSIPSINFKSFAVVGGLSKGPIGGGIGVFFAKALKKKGAEVKMLTRASSVSLFPSSSLPSLTSFSTHSLSELALSSLSFHSDRISRRQRTRCSGDHHHRGRLQLSLLSRFSSPRSRRDRL